MNRNIPNFFIVGAPKSGTTSFFKYLDGHPDVFMSPLKEPNFFSYDVIEQQGLFYAEKGVSTLNDYLKLFKEVTNQKVIGEASVSYLFYDGIAEKIKVFNAESKVLILLRNPVERAISHYEMDYRLGYVKKPLLEIINSNQISDKLHFQQYIELGLYSNQIKRYKNVFDERHLKIYLTDEFISDPRHVIQDLYHFLNISENYSPDLRVSHNSYLNPKNRLIANIYRSKWLRSVAKNILPGKLTSVIKHYLFKSERNEIDEKLITQLKLIYKADILSTEKVIGKTLSNWYE